MEIKNSKFNYCVCSKREKLANIKPDKRRNFIIINLIVKRFNIIFMVKEKIQLN